MGLSFLCEKYQARQRFFMRKRRAGILTRDIKLITIFIVVMKGHMDCDKVVT